MSDTGTEPEATEEAEQSESGEYQTHTQQQKAQENSEQEHLPNDNDDLEPAAESHHELTIDGEGEATVEEAPVEAEPEASGEE